MSSQAYITYPGVHLEPNVSIGEFSVLGKPPRPSKHGGERTSSSDLREPTTLGAETDVGSFVLIEEGVRIGRQCVIETGAVVETRAVVGDRCFIVHGARLCAGCVVGEDSVIGGFIAERSIVGEHSRVFGKLIHRQLDPTLPWDDASEPAPVLAANVFVGMGAIVIGPARLGTHVYVAAGAVVTKDVPPFSIVHGTNCVREFGRWKGRLPRSPFWGSGR